MLTRLDERYKNLRELFKEAMAEVRALKGVAYEIRGRVDVLEATRAEWLKEDAKGHTGLTKAIERGVLAHLHEKDEALKDALDAYMREREKVRRVSWREWGGWLLGVIATLVGIVAYLKQGG